MTTINASQNPSTGGWECDTLSNDQIAKEIASAVGQGFAYGVAIAAGVALVQGLVKFFSR